MWWRYALVDIFIQVYQVEFAHNFFEHLVKLDGSAIFLKVIFANFEDNLGQNGSEDLKNFSNCVL
jgi:hypothetical protein